MKRLIVCIMAFAMLGGVAKADWQPSDGHKMHFPQLPNPEGWDVSATGNNVQFPPLVLADDWMCSETGWVKDIHFWGSWKGDDIGEIISFHLSIHADIPADQSPYGYSMPGPILWAADLFQGDWIEAGPFPGPQGWYDPYIDFFEFPDHGMYFQYNVFIPEPFWFPQEAGTIYWLDISAIVADPEFTQWGWKTSIEHWNDDGVFSFGVL